MAETIYLDVARLRWPNYSISGAGKIAVVLPCQQKIILCEIPLQSEPIRVGDCQPCVRRYGDRKIHHRTIVLNEPKPAYTRVHRIKPCWERDKCDGLPRTATREGPSHTSSGQSKYSNPSSCKRKAREESGKPEMN
jgi:hypothetical protein